MMYPATTTGAELATGTAPLQLGEAMIDLCEAAGRLTPAAVRRLRCRLIGMRRELADLDDLDKEFPAIPVELMQGAN